MGWFSGRQETPDEERAAIVEEQKARENNPATRAALEHAARINTGTGHKGTGRDV